MDFPHLILAPVEEKKRIAVSQIQVVPLVDPVKVKAKKKKPIVQEEKKILAKPELYNLESLLCIQKKGWAVLQIKYGEQVYSFEIEVYHKPVERTNHSKILFYKSKNDSSIKETVLSLWGLQKGTKELTDFLYYDKNTGSRADIAARQMGHV